MTAGLVQAPSALAALTDQPSDAAVRKASSIAQDAGIALTHAAALNNVVAATELPLDVPEKAVALSDLAGDVKALQDPEELTGERLKALASDVVEKAHEVRAETAALRAALINAREAEAARIAAEEAKRAAEEAAAEAARIEAEKAAAAAAAQAAANTVEGAKATAREMAASRYGWGDGQFSCLDSLWDKESDWNYRAYNPSSGATGIPQALPGDKMATAGGDWRTNASTQIAWGLGYIAAAYGTPCNAWGHSQATDWY